MKIEKWILNISKILRRLHSDSLFRNSFYLMASTYIMAFIGFFFWMIVTRLYSAEDVGLATTLISVTGLITSFSLFGLNTALIRFLPTAKNKNNLINTAFTLIAIGSVLVTVIFLTGLPVFSPRLTFIRSSPMFMLSFIVFMVVASLNGITDSVFIANRDTKYIPLTNTVMSMVKLVLPVFLVGLGAYGIFYSIVFSVNVAMVMSIFLLTFLFGYQFIPRIDMREVRKLWKFSFGNYLAGLFGMLPSLTLPIIITNSLGPKVTAYYYVPMMIASLLFAIPSAIGQSLYSEGSNQEKDLNTFIKKSIKVTFSIVIPISLILIVFGKNILLLFGREYSMEGMRFLQLLSLSSLVVPINTIGGYILQIKMKIHTSIVMGITGSLLTLSLCFLFMVQHGLIGIGIGFTISRSLIGIIYLILMKFYLRKV